MKYVEKKIVVFSLSILLIFSGVMPVFANEVSGATNGAEQTEGYTLESEQFKNFIIEGIRNNQSVIDVSDFDIRVDVTNGCHILSDFQDDLLYEYTEDAFCVENLTFKHQNGKLLSIKVNYAADLNEIDEMRAAVSARVDEIVAEVSDIEDETEKIGKISELIWSNYYDDFVNADIWTQNVYGCLVRGYASRFGAACGFQAVMHRLGYKGGYYLSGADIYSKNLIDGTWKYTNIAWNQSRKNNTYLLTDVTESVRNYGKQALTSEEYTPISMFSDNPYLNQRNENSQYLAEQFLAGNTKITLPNPVYYNYRKGYSNYIINIKHEYPDVGFLVGSCGTSVKNDLLTVTPTYIEEEDVREDMLNAFYNEVDKIVERANRLETPEEKIIFVNNYITKTTTYKEYENGVKLPYSHDAYGCLVNGECVCEGYATAFHMIMKELGIDDTFVQSYNHIWNKVLLNGEYKVMDVTNNGDNHYLLGYNHEANSPNGSLRLSRYTYALNNTLSMNSSSTKYVVEELSKGSEYIDTSDINFWLDRRSKLDTKWYIDTLKNIYPIEMRDVDTMEFVTDGDNILGINVTYKERTAEDIEAFEAVVDSIVASAETKATEEEKVAAVMSGMYRSGIKGSTSGEEDVVNCTINKAGTYLAKTRLCCYVLEKLGIRYTVIKDRNVYYYVKTVYDGTVRYSSPVLSGYINLEEIVSYYIFNDYRVFDFVNPDVENAYLDGSDFDMDLEEMFIPSHGTVIEPDEPDEPEIPDDPVVVSMSDVTIEGIEDKVYTGGDIKQDLVVSYEGIELIENQDYTVSYSNNCNVGVATITLIGIGNYEGTIERTFNVLKCSISSAFVEGLEDTYLYTGESIIPSFTVNLVGTTLTKGTDYEVSFDNNINVGTGKVTVTGIGNYNDKVVVVFDILPVSLKDAEITGIESVYEYTGSAITPKVSVKLNGKLLDEGADYNVVYDNNKEVGTASVVISGSGNYCESVSRSFDIVNNSVSISSAKISGLTSSYTYTGEAIEPSFIVQLNGVTLKKGTDYTVSFKDNVNIGTAKVEIVGKGKYYGSLSTSFRISQISISKGVLTGLQSSYPYTGSAIVPDVILKVNDKILVKGVDYEINCENNVNVGTVKYIVSGIGNYAGSISKSFRIDAVSLTTASVTGISSSYVYTGQNIVPAVTVKIGSKTLVKDVDYSVSYSNNLKVGTATVSINGIGNYTGKLSRSFKIVVKSISGASVSGVSSSYVYTGKGISPTVNVKLGGKTLIKGTDYKVVYSNNVKVGTAKIIITGIGNYSGSISKSFKIVKASIGKASISGVKAKYKYTKKAIKPVPILKYNGKTLKKGTDYTISYSSNKKVGTAKITIKGKGNFTGTYVKKFKIKK